MATKARGPNILKGALVTIDATKPTPQVVPFYYNPSSLRRSLQPQQVGGEENDRSEAIRFTGAPVQTITVEVEIDVTDQLESGDSAAMSYGALPQLSSLELLVYPSLSQISQNQSQLASGVMEVSPLTAPRTLFVWGAKRVLPVRINSYEITEEIFDAQLNPIRATLTLAMRVLNYSDLDSSNEEYHEFMTYQQNLVVLASNLPTVDAKELIGIDPSSL
jgi:Contractile injection system tube protein